MLSYQDAPGIWYNAGKSESWKVERRFVESRTMSEQTYFKTRLRKKGQITIPSQVREILRVGEGDDLVFYVNESGQVMVERLQTISPDQAWFWTERWQKMEREAQSEIDAGRVHRYSDVEDAIQALEKRADAGD
jgi:AbrB family looped-hinge helix DNA binding protein